MPALVANQIAAGEVVERPASVVKELVENALDAGATQITVELEQGGVELIRVGDDGGGIPQDELSLALAAHATSKLREAQDLDRIATMGFRGEALASITSVARVNIRSRTPAQPAAAEISGEGDVVQAVRPASGPVGTVVSVRTLFFNTPARRRFLRTPATEQGRCVEVVRQLALAHPAVGFKVTCDARVSLDLRRGQGPRERALEVLGRELEPELLEIGADHLDTGGALNVWGLIGTPEIARATAGAMYIFVRGRPVRDRTLQHAVREAYRGLIEPGRYPTAVVMIEMDPGAVDVNVHPAKAEVRFRDSSAVHQAVLRACRRGLQGADLTPRVPLGDGGGVGPPGSQAMLGPSHAGSTARVISAAALAQQLRVPPAAPGPASAGGDGVGSPGVGLASSTWNLNPGEPARAVMDRTLGPAPASGGEVGAAAGPISSTGGAGGPSDQTLLDASPGSPAIQVHNSFLVTQDAQGVVIIDQHALHERVMFEKLLARIGSGDLESQRLLLPAVLNVSARQIEALETLRPLLKRIGTEVEPSGPASLAVHAMASFLFERGVEPGPFVSELLERAADSGFGADTEEALREVLDMMACKAAVKAGDHLSEVELAELLALRDRVERSSNCPHGRPTSIRLSIRELEKRFGRS